MIFDKELNLKLSLLHAYKQVQEKFTPMNKGL